MFGFTFHSLIVSFFFFVGSNGCIEIFVNVVCYVNKFVNELAHSLTLARLFLCNGYFFLE